MNIQARRGKEKNIYIKCEMYKKIRMIFFSADATKLAHKNEPFLFLLISHFISA
jgi:hypothetical protein